MIEFFSDPGTSVSRFIFWISSFLTEDQAPGLVSIAIVLGLLIAVVMVVLSANRKINALSWLEGQVRKAKNEEEFAAQVNAISREVRKLSGRKGYGSVAAGWNEFRETLIEDKKAVPPVLRNSVRPSSFFNLEDLHFGPGFSRYLPGLFVTVGLFFTFLGLIAALRQITGLSEASPEEMRASLDGLLAAASAKFIMSLTGLLASIIFTVVLRILTGKVEQRIHILCADLEDRLTFISLETLAMEQLEIARGQKDSFLEIGTTLVSELGRSLQKEIPESISNSISTAMAPLLEQVGKAGTDGVEQMVADLSSKFSDDVGTALSKASQELSAASDKIAGLSDMIDRSSVQISNAVSQIESSGEVTRSAAEALTIASRDLQGAAAPIRTSVERIESATTGLSKSMADATETVTRSSKETAQGAAEVLDTAKAAIGMEKKLIEASLANLAEALENIERQRAQIDDMDEKLGAAFDKFASHVKTSLDTFADHVRKMNGELAPALDTMREIVDQAEKFRPEQRR